MKTLTGLLVFLICLGLGSGYAQGKDIGVKGTVIQIELGPSEDPSQPNLWPGLYAKGKEIMLVGKPDILEELAYLIGRKVALTAKQLPTHERLLKGSILKSPISAVAHRSADIARSGSRHPPAPARRDRVLLRPRPSARAAQRA